MKKILCLVVMALIGMSMSNIHAQNDFKGIIKYTIKSSGEMTVDIPADASFELRVMGEMMYANDQACQYLQGPFCKSLTVNGLKVTTANDYSQLLAYISAQGESLATYTGDGKMIINQTFTQNDVDSLTIPCTEGFYIEYVDGQNKEVADRTAKLAKLHMFDEEGKDHVMQIWYDETMGPKYNFFLYGIKGMPLEFTQSLSEGKAITISAVEVKKGKVKDVDFLMPDGYKVVTDEEMETFVSELQEVMKYLQDE